MKAWLQRIQSWHAGKELRSLQWWEQTRTRGKARFVFEAALTYGFMFVGTMDVFQSLVYGNHYISLGHLVSSLLAGIPVGWVGWSSMEAKYQKALHEARIKALPASSTTPHDHP